MGTSKGIMGIVALTLGLVLSAIPLLAQPGYTPGEAIPVTPGVWEYNSLRTPSVSFNSPSGCFPYNGPYYDEYWFKFTAGKEDKLLYVDASTTRGVDEGLPNRVDFRAILFVFEMTESGLSQIGCHAYGATWILHAHPGRTYLFMVAGLDSTAVPGEDPQYTGHGGSITLTLESNPHGVVQVRGTTDSLDAFWDTESPDLLMSFHATNPDFWCGPSSDSTPMRWHLTTISAGTMHSQVHGQVYTIVFRFSTLDEMLAAIDTIDLGNYCSLLTSQWVVAEGIANWSNTDNNLINSTGNKPDSWGVRVTGRLKDLTGSCPAGGTASSVHYEIVCPKLSHQEQCWPNCCRENWHPPRLSCDGQ